jgi:hypothetical protein
MINKPNDEYDEDDDYFPEITFYGVMMSCDADEDASLTIDYCRIIFMHPKISAKKAVFLIKYDSKRLPQQELIKKWSIEINQLLLQIDNNRKLMDLTDKMARKIVKWSQYFSMPSFDELEEMADNLNLPMDELFESVLHYFKMSMNSPKEVNLFLRIYSPYMALDTIDGYLEKLNSLKRSEEEKGGC